MMKLRVKHKSCTPGSNRGALPPFSPEPSAKIGRTRRPSSFVRLSFVGSRNKNRTSRIEPSCGSFILLFNWGARQQAYARCVATARPSDGDPALGVFFRFQIPDFDLFFGFFSLCHFFLS